MKAPDETLGVLEKRVTEVVDGVKVVVFGGHVRGALGAYCAPPAERDVNQAAEARTTPPGWVDKVHLKPLIEVVCDADQCRALTASRPHSKGLAPAGTRSQAPTSGRGKVRQVGAEHRAIACRSPRKMVLRWGATWMECRRGCGAELCG